MVHHITKTFLTVIAASIAVNTACAQWAQITPTTSPSARSGPGAATMANGDILMTGGALNVGASNQTWRYDGTTWTQLGTGPTKAGFDLVHDTNRAVFVAYGGTNTSPFGGASNNQTWEFDGTTWTQVTPLTTTPGGLGLYGACFDSVRNKLVLYGGLANSMFPIDSNITWEWNGIDWAQITTVGNPGPLERPAMCFHAGIAKTVMFGGIDVQIGGVDTTWLYDGTTWSAAPVTGPKPSVRTGAKMAYDSIRGVCVLTGGVDPFNGNAIVDTWEFDGTAWAQVPSVTTGRYSAALAFSPARRQMVQFGGVSPPFATLGDTWEYGAKLRTFGTGCAGTNGVPALTANDAPRLGSPFTLTLGNLNPAVNVGVIVFGGTELPGIPLDGIGMPGCLAYASPDLLFTITGAAGSASWNWPSVAAPFGASLVMQGLSLDPVNPLWLVASNAVAVTVGN